MLPGRSGRGIGRRAECLALGERINKVIIEGMDAAILTPRKTLIAVLSLVESID